MIINFWFLLVLSLGLDDDVVGEGVLWVWVLVVVLVVVVVGEKVFVNEVEVGELGMLLDIVVMIVVILICFVVIFSGVEDMV